MNTRFLFDLFYYVYCQVDNVYQMCRKSRQERFDLACQTGDISTVRKLYSTAVDLNHVFDLAKTHNQLEVIRFCIEQGFDTEQEFLLACQNGNMLLVKALYTPQIDLKNAFLVAVNHNQIEVVRFCIDNGVTDLDKGLEIACLNNRHALAELFVQKGANTIVGKRACKSTNILRMIQRYEQKDELIK